MTTTGHSHWSLIDQHALHGTKPALAVLNAQGLETATVCSPRPEHRARRIAIPTSMHAASRNPAECRPRPHHRASTAATFPQLSCCRHVRTTRQAALCSHQFKGALRSVGHVGAHVCSSGGAVEGHKQLVWPRARTSGCLHLPRDGRCSPLLLLFPLWPLSCLARSCMAKATHASPPAVVLNPGREPAPLICVAPLLLLAALAAATHPHLLACMRQWRIFPCALSQILHALA